MKYCFKIIYTNVLLYVIFRKYRYTAYRQLARWAWGYLEKRVRVVSPSSAMITIQRKLQPLFQKLDCQVIDSKSK